TFSVLATDPSGNLTTRQYQVTNTGTAKSFTYDANGNLTSDGTRTFEWDARNQLSAVNLGTHRSEFVYDGQQRRVRILEKQNGTTQSDTRFVWCGAAVCEERTPDGQNVTRRHVALGQQTGASAQFF